MKRDQKEIEFLLRTTLRDVTKVENPLSTPGITLGVMSGIFARLLLRTSARYYDDKVACSSADNWKKDYANPIVQWRSRI